MVLAILGASIAMQSPKVQGWAAEKAIDMIRDKLDGSISFSSLEIQGLNSFVATDLLVRDSLNSPFDTLLYMGRVSGTFSGKSLFGKGGIKLGRIDADRVESIIFLNETEEYGNSFSRFLQSHSTDTTKGDGSFGLYIGRIDVRNARFRMVNRDTSGRKPGVGSINWKDMDARASVIQGHALRVRGGLVTAVADKICINEKCGYSIDILGARVRAGYGKVEVEDLHAVDEWSDVKVPLYSMTGTAHEYSEYTSNVLMKLKMDRSTLSSKTLSAFSKGVFNGKEFLLDVTSADAHGRVNDLYIDRIRFKDLNGGVQGDISGGITGVLKTPNPAIDAQVASLQFSTVEAERFLRKLLPGKTPSISRYAKGTRFNFKGRAKGTLNKLTADGKLNSNKGRLQATLDLRNLADSKRNTELRGSVSSKNLDLGNMTGLGYLGKCTANTGFRSVMGGKRSSLVVDSLIVDKLGLLGYDYTGIAAAGKYSDKSFDGKIICGDPNLNFIFQGLFNVSGETNNALYKFFASVGYADLQALKLDNRGGASKVSGQMSANFMKTGKGDLLGDFDVLDLVLENDQGVKNIGNIHLGSHSNGNVSRAQFESSFLDAGYVGNRSLADIWKDIQTVTTRRDLPALYKASDPDKGDPNSEYDISFRFHDSRDLLSFVRPGLYIADSTNIDLRLRQGWLNGRVTSPRLAYRTNYLKGLDIMLDNMDHSANATLITTEMNLGGLGFSNSALTGYAQSNEFFLSFHYDNIRGLDNMGEIYLAGNIARDATDTLMLTANPLSSYIRFNGTQWDMAESTITYRAGDASFDRFLMFNGDQNISLNGRLSMHSPDTLRLGIDRVDLGVINYFTDRKYAIGGRSSGNAVISSPAKGGMRALLNLGCDSLRVNGEDAGTLRLAALWDRKEDRLTGFLRNNYGGQDALKAGGTVHMKERNAKFYAAMDKMNLVVLAPFLTNVFSDVGGSLSGSVQAEGQLDSLRVTSSGARVDDAHFRVGFTNVAYKLNGPLHVDENGLEFDSVSISDDEDGSGVLRGGIRFSNFRDPSLDASLRLYKMKLMGTSTGENIYGNIYASGDIHATGPFDAISIDADVSTDKAGDLHIPLGGSSSASSGDLLSFTDHSVKKIDPYEQMMMEILENEERARKAAARSDLTARCRINATPELEAILELDNTGDNTLSARGSGLITIDLQAARDKFDIGGDYNISGGKYQFALPGIVRKEFNIDTGSSIKFNGKVPDSELDIGATYSLRTSINRLLADTSSVATRRTVNCGLRITDKLSSPQLHFNIDIPDLDPTTKSEVQSALNTEDKVQKQFLALLVTGSFIQEEQSGVVNNTNIVFSNFSEMMSRQLSNILARMDIPLDLGVGYQQNSAGTGIYDVSVSTELFNNRVEVHGSVGNRQYGTTSNPDGDMVGDLDIDVKLDRQGQIRLNLFSHSADQYTSYLDYSQRNGVGITYQKEFNSWKDFFRNLFRGKKRERKQQEAPGTVTLELGDD